jgi:hypothetical protein
MQSKTCIDRLTRLETSFLSSKIASRAFSGKSYLTRIARPSEPRPDDEIAPAILSSASLDALLGGYLDCDVVSVGSHESRNIPSLHRSQAVIGENESVF